MRARQKTQAPAPTPVVTEGGPELIDLTTAGGDLRSSVLSCAAANDADGVRAALAGVTPEERAALVRDREVWTALLPVIGAVELGALASGKSDDEKKQLDFEKDLGQAEDFSVVATLVGAYLDSLGMAPGQFFKGKVKLNLHVGGASGFALGLELGVGGMRLDKGGYELKADASFTVGGYFKAGLFRKFELKAEIGAQLTAFAKARGQSAAQCVELVGLGVKQRLDAFLGERAGNAVFGKGYEERVVSQMKPKEKVEGKADKTGKVGEEAPAVEPKELAALDAAEVEKAEGENKDVAKSGKEKKSDDFDYVEMGSSASLYAGIEGKRKDKATGKYDKAGGKITTGIEKSRKYYKAKDEKTGKYELKEEKQGADWATTVEFKFNDFKGKIKYKKGLGKEKKGKHGLDISFEGPVAFSMLGGLVDQSSLTVFAGLTSAIVDHVRAVVKGEESDAVGTSHATLEQHAQLRLVELIHENLAEENKKNAKFSSFKDKSKAKVGIDIGLKKGKEPGWKRTGTLSLVNVTGLELALAAGSGPEVSAETEFAVGKQVTLW
jgi:hypothetical protein